MSKVAPETLLGTLTISALGPRGTSTGGTTSRATSTDATSPEAIKVLDLRAYALGMEKLFLIVVLFFTSCFGLNGQDSIKSTHLQFGFIPQVGSISNGTKQGKGRLNPGYVIEAGLIHLISQRISVETRIHLQKVNLKHRSNNLQWPADVENGQWVPGRSYEQFEADYLAVGLSIGFNLKLTGKDNSLALHWSGIVRRVIDFDDNLVINESGHITHDGDIELHNEVSKFQILLGLGLNYDVAIDHKSVFSIGPSFEYSVRDLLSASEPNLLWAYEGGHPLFLGVKITFKRKV